MSWWQDLLGIKSKTDNLPATPASEDGVYFDSINGVPGTAWPVGTPGTPSNNLTDVIAISVSRKTKNIYKSTNAQLTDICGFMVTVAGGWAGNAKVRITDGAGNKIFPFPAEYVEGTDFSSAVQFVLNFPLRVRDYKFQFRSSAGGDGAGKTLQLNNLNVTALKG